MLHITELKDGCRSSGRTLKDPSFLKQSRRALHFLAIALITPMKFLPMISYHRLSNVIWIEDHVSILLPFICVCVCARAWHRREREGEGRIRIASCADSHCLIQSSLYTQIFFSRTDYSLSFHTVFANFSPAPFCKWNVIKVREILTYFLLPQEL